ncbi:hypothetical protein TWF506_004679 [Arthrobotrys conoides]|uniref:F-box domain-containing protein n=1 Tax=Arthrobotrys conoides TaxID=74498 RepID=A0AAN8N029_9PEZI
MLSRLLARVTETIFSLEGTAEITRNASTVLRIPELLELILCHVADWPFFESKNVRPVKDTDSLIDLYHCSLVCKFWKGVVDASPSISRKAWKYDVTRSIPLEHQKSPLDRQAPEGESYPTINYPFISWLSRRVPRCFQAGTTYNIRNLHAQYLKDKFPPSYFSNPPRNEVYIELRHLQLGISRLLCNLDSVSAIFINRRDNYFHPSQGFAVKNKNGITVEDIVRAIEELMDLRLGEGLDSVSYTQRSNGFREIRVGIFKPIEPDDRDGVHRWSSIGRYGSFVTSRSVEEPQTYEISSELKL